MYLQPATADKEQIQAAVMKKAAWIAGKLYALIILSPFILY
jgi:hypothetical protein